MYYEVLINGTLFATVGHSEIVSMNLSVQLVSDEAEVFASAVCRENGELWFYDWFQHPVAASDTVSFRQSAGTMSVEPRNKYNMRKEAR